MSRIIAMYKNRKADFGMDRIFVLIILLVFLFLVIMFTTNVGKLITNMIKGFFGMFG